jgi:hypothetical protein
MSFSGAAVGSGSVEKIARGRDLKTLGRDDGKKLVRDEIGRQRATLEDLYKKHMREDWTNQLNGVAMWEAASNAPEPLDFYDTFLWGQMFPGVPYDGDRFNTIRNNARMKIEGALADYNLQWRTYQTQISMPRNNQSYALYAMGTLAIPKPFEPKLNFGKY